MSMKMNRLAPFRLPSVPDPRSCIGSLPALGDVDSKRRRGAMNQLVCYGGYFQIDCGLNMIKRYERVDEHT